MYSILGKYKTIATQSLGVRVMPQITVYIKEEDIPRWKAIKHKAEWIRSHLNGERYEKQTSNTTKPVRPTQIKEITYEPIIPLPEVKVIKQRPIDLTTILANKKIRSCEHGFAVGLCKFNCKKGMR